MKNKVKQNRINHLVLSLITGVILVLGVVFASVLGLSNTTYVNSENSTTTSSTNENSINSAWYTTTSGSGISISGQVANFSYAGSIQSITLNAGLYYLQVWGASGGKSTHATRGGNGGYSAGTITLSATTTLYVVVGGQGVIGTATRTAGGYNGGGASGGNTGVNDTATGGGATHIATATGLLSSLSSNKTAVKIVAGGGGGGGCSNTIGGEGGGTSGIAAVDTQSYGGPGGPGTQSAGGAAGSNSSAGTFGKGGDSGYSQAWPGGGGGGGYYGGGGGGNMSGGGCAGGGGSGYIGGVTSATVNSVAYNAQCIAGNASQPSTSGGTQTGHVGNGYAKITCLNQAITQSSVPTGKVFPRTSYTLSRTTGGNINLGLTDADNDTIRWASNNIYTNSACTTLATEWLSYSNLTSGTTGSVTIIPQKYWTGTKTFYTLADDSGNGTDVTVSFKLNMDNYNMTAKSGSNITGVGASYKHMFGASTIAVPSTQGTANAVYNPLGTGLSTLFIATPLTSGKSISIAADELVSHTASYSRFVLSGLSYGSSRYHIESGASESASAGTYVTATLSGSVANVNGASLGQNTLTITPKAEQAAGPYYYYVQFTITPFDYYGGDQLYNSSGAVQPMTYYVVFRVDNTRPQYASEVWGIKPIADLSINSEKTFTLASDSSAYSNNALVKDPDGDSVNNLTIEDVVVPANEYARLDKYGKALPLNDGGLYNVGVSVGTSYTGTVLTSTAQYGASTSFKPTTVYNGNTNITSSQAASQGSATTANVKYAVSADKKSITITGLSATYNQYAVYTQEDYTSSNSITNGGSYRANLGEDVTGHLYILIRVTDKADVADTGIWYPLAIRVKNTAPVASASPATFTGNVGDSVVFTPMSVSGTLGTAIGSTDVTTASTNYLGLATPLASDADSVTKWDGLSYSDYVANSGDYAYNDVTFLANTEYNSKNVFTTPSYYNGFMEISRVQLYAPALTIAGLSQDYITSSEGDITTSSTALFQRGYLSGDSFVAGANAEGKYELIRFWGIKVTLKRFTTGSSGNADFYGIRADIIDTRGSSLVTGAAVKCNIDDGGIVANGNVSSVVNVGGTEIAPQFRSIIKNTNGEDRNVTYSYEDAHTFTLQLYRGESARLTAYDLFSVTSMADGIVSSGASANTNVYDVDHDTAMDKINGVYAVYASDTASGAIAAATAGSSVSRTYNQIKLSVVGANISSNTYGAATYTEESTTSDVTTAEYIEFNAKNKTAVSTQYFSIEIKAVDLSSHEITATIILRVLNTAPKLKADDNVQPYYSLSTTVSSDVYENSSQEGSVGGIYDEKEDGTNYHKLSASTFTVREYALNDLVTDVDGDLISWVNMSTVNVGTFINGTFKAFNASENVYVRAYIGTGSGIRSGNSAVLKVEALSSTQGLTDGLFIELYVSDTVEQSYLYVQVEVLNVAPTFNTSGFEASESLSSVEYEWTFKGVSLSGSDAKYRSVYLASDSLAIDYLEATVQNGASAQASGYDAFPIQPDANFNVSAMQVNYVVSDEDDGQGVVLHMGNGTQLPSYQYYSDTASSHGWYNESTVVSVTNPYASATSLINTAFIAIYTFSDDGEILSASSTQHYRVGTDYANYKAYEYLRENATIDDVYKSIKWVIEIRPYETFSQSMQVTLRVRDSNRDVSLDDGTAIGREGGQTLNGENSYKGLRKNGAVAQPDSIREFKFALSMRGTGLINNFTDWEEGGWKAELVDEETEVVTKTYSYFEAFNEEKIFSYDEILVSASGSSTYVPISYFTWVAENRLPLGQGETYRTVAWYTSDAAVTKYKLDDSGKQYLDSTTLFNMSITDVAPYITVTDNVSKKTWSGATLNSNPYFEIATVQNQNAEFKAGEYLSEQLRFSAALDGSGNVAFSNYSPSAQDGIAYEDDYGLTFTKKANHVRTMNNVSVSIQFEKWGRHDVYSAGSLTQGWIADDGNTKITVSVPVTVENTGYTYQNDSISYKTTVNASSTTFVIPDKDEFFSAETYKIYEIDDTDYYSVDYHDDVLFSYASVRPDENKQLMTSVLNYLFTAEGTADSITLSGVSERGDVDAILKNYFKVSSLDELAEMVELNDSGEITLKEKLINKNYSNYVGLSSTVDSKQLSLTPIRQTTFDHKGLSDDEIATKALERGLSYDTETKRIYYSLGVLTYDTFNSSNITSGYVSAVSISVEIVNSSPYVISSNVVTETEIATSGTSASGTTKEGSFSYAVLDMAKGDTGTIVLSTYFNDADMKKQDGVFRGEDYYRQSDVSQLDKDTADYISELNVYAVNPSGTGSNVGVAGGATRYAIEYDASNVKEDNQITIKVNDTVSSYIRANDSDYAGYIIVEFKDLSGEDVSVLFAIKIKNSAPKVAYANTFASGEKGAGAYTNFSLVSGQYFTLAVTPWSEFARGAEIDKSANNTTVKYSNGVWSGTIVERVANSSASGTFEKWNYAPSSTVAISGTNFDEKLKQGIISDGASNTQLNNLGYAAIVEDDSAWNLRIRKYTCNSSAIEIDELNKIPENPKLDGTTYATAIRVIAKGPCDNVRVTITVGDGEFNVDYAFSISVTSTAPEGIPTNNPTALGESLRGTKYADRLLFNTSGDTTYAESETYKTKTATVYDLIAYVGDEIVLKASDLAVDRDAGDSERLFFMKAYSGSAFSITQAANDEILSSGTDYINVVAEQTNVTYSNLTQLKITAKDFPNGNYERNYDVIEVLISDPYLTDVNYAIKILIRVFVFPSQNVSTSTKTHDEIKSVTDYTNSDEGTEIQIVGSDESAYVIDADYRDENYSGKYSVKVYSSIYKKTDGTYAHYTASNMLSNLTDDRLLARYDASNGESYFATEESVNEAVATVLKYVDLSAGEFRKNGAVLYLVPKKSTHNAEAMVQITTLTNGIGLYIQVEKHLDRDIINSYDLTVLNKSSSADKLKGVAKSALYQEKSVSLTVRNSAPISVVDNSYNYNVDKSYPNVYGPSESEIEKYGYLQVTGYKGGRAYYYAYNPINEQEALAIDPDGDEVTVKKVEVKRVYYVNKLSDGSDEIIEFNTLSSTMQAFTGKNSAVSASIEKLYVDKERTIGVQGVAVKINSKVTNELSDGADVWATYEVTLVDSSGSTEATITQSFDVCIKNSTPTVRSVDEIDATLSKNAGLAGGESESDIKTRYSVKRDGDDYEITLTLRAQDGPVTIGYADLILDNDYDPKQTGDSAEKLIPVAESDVQTTYLNEIYVNAVNKTIKYLTLTADEKAVVYTEREQTKESDFVIYSDANNTGITFETNSYSRGLTRSVTLVVSDSSGLRASSKIKINLVVGNTAPKTVAENLDVTLNGGKKGDGDNDNFAHETFVITYSDENAKGFVYDLNPADAETLTIKDLVYLKPTFNVLSDFKAFNALMSGNAGDSTGEEDEAKPVAMDDETPPATLAQIITTANSVIIQPYRYVYGTQVVTLTVTDGSDVDALSVTFNLKITVTNNPQEMHINDLDVHYMRSKPITAYDLFRVKDEDGIEIDLSADMHVVEVRNRDGADNTGVTLSEENGTYYVYGARVGSTGKFTAVIRVGDGEKLYEVPFDVKVSENYRPIYTEKWSGTRPNQIDTIGVGEGDGVVRISIDEIFYDQEGDEITVESAKSKKTAVVTVSVDKAESPNELVFRFKGAGDSEITVVLKDALGVAYEYKFKVLNIDRPELNFLMSTYAEMQERPWFFIMIGALIILAIIILIAIIAAVKKKRRIQAEVEALLVSEMELEEQMLKLAASPNNPAYTSFGYLPPSQGIPPQSSGFMLGTGHNIPQGGNAIGLNPGANNTSAPNTQYNQTSAPQNSYGQTTYNPYTNTQNGKTTQFGTSNEYDPNSDLNFNDDDL